MRIGFIGAGKVATAIGRYMYGTGISISGYFDRHPGKSAHAVRKTQSITFNSMAEVADHSDIIFIATRDDQIAGVSRQLCEKDQIKPYHWIGHMSGAHSSQILHDVQKAGANVFSLHPLQAFADEDKALSELPKTYFSLEGEKEGLTPIVQLLEKIKNPYFLLRPEHKSLYHLCACMLSNYLVTLMQSGLAALEKTGIDPVEGFEAMRPLIEGTLANIAELGPAQALTGPIARGDAGTIARHLEALSSSDLKEARSIYTFLGLKTLELATQKNLNAPDKAASIKQLLQKTERNELWPEPNFL